jgi:hypothetical protein
MEFFLDTEFSENGPYDPVQLISVGIVCKGGELYAISSEFDPEFCNPWVRENVLPRLENEFAFHGSLSEIAAGVLSFVSEHSNGEKPRFIGYYADYDWVVFCQMYGAMVNLPKGWPMYCFDLKQWCDEMGNPKLPPDPVGEHNALADARWNMLAYESLKEHEELLRDARIR